MNHKVTCGNCGGLVVVPCRRHNKPGTGFHGSKDLKKLGPTETLCVEALEMKNADNVWTASELGLTSRRVHQDVLDIMRARTPPGEEEPHVDVNSVRRALSYLQGDGPFQLVTSAPNILRLLNEDELSFRMEKGDVWFLLRPEGLGLLRKS